MFHYLERWVQLVAVGPCQAVVLVKSDGYDPGLVQLLKVDVTDILEWERLGTGSEKLVKPSRVFDTEIIEVQREDALLCCLPRTTRLGIMSRGDASTRNAWMIP